MSNRNAVFITAEELNGLLSGEDRPAVLDVRWRLDQPDGYEAYLRGHIPGAMYVSLDEDLSDHSVTGRGRHPLPSGADLQAAVRRWGLRRGQPVVVYDDWNRAGSSRAWWVLTAAGLDDVRILDGGLAAWTSAGGELQTGRPNPVAGDVVLAHQDLYAGARPVMTADDVAGGTATLLDARAPERFRGEVEPVDPIAGHIPGAVNVPSTSLLDDDGKFLDDSALGSRLGRYSPGTAVYCGSGVTASVVLAALSAVGVQAALFPGSWSQWSGEGRPVERG